MNIHTLTLDDISRALNRHEGRGHDWVGKLDTATNADLEGRTLPCSLYDILEYTDSEGKVTGMEVEEVTIVRYGVNLSVGATSPSVTIQHGRLGPSALASADMFYLTREDAERAIAIRSGAHDAIDFATNIVASTQRIDEARIGTWMDPKTEQWCATPYKEYRGAVANSIYKGATRQEAGLRCYLALQVGNEIILDADSDPGVDGTHPAP